MIFFSTLLWEALMAEPEEVTTMIDGPVVWAGSFMYLWLRCGPSPDRPAEPSRNCHDPVIPLNTCIVGFIQTELFLCHAATKWELLCVTSYRSFPLGNVLFLKSIFAWNSLNKCSRMELLCVSMERWEFSCWHFPTVGHSPSLAYSSASILWYSFVLNYCIHKVPGCGLGAGVL